MSTKQVFRDRIIRLLRTAKFRVSKDRSHAYTLREYWEDDEDFIDCVQFIRKHGSIKFFYGRPYTYLEINGYKYWSMGNPIPETILINRVKTEEWE